jgi:hypothetical protein
VQKRPAPALISHDVSRNGEMRIGFNESMTIPGFLKENKRGLVSLPMDQLNPNEVFDINFILKSDVDMSDI